MKNGKIAEIALLLIVVAFSTIIGLVSLSLIEDDDEKNCKKLDGEFIVVYKKEMPLLEEPFEVFECKKVKK